MTHEFKQVLWVSTPLGDGVAILHLDYGANSNGILLVGLESGEMRYFDILQCKLCRNDTLGIATPER